ncbi:MAG: GFA family protein [Gammaproteobacteria bacterium]
MTKPEIYTGSCLCGNVKYEINGMINDIVMCHCSLCRKAQGSAFATNANVAANDFRFVSGEENLTAYEANPGQIKYFCKTCGSPIMSKQLKRPELIRIRLGLVESNIVERPHAHIYVSSKANWEIISGDLAQFDETITT